MPWARASSLDRHLMCPLASSLPQYDRGSWKPAYLKHPIKWRWREVREPRQMTSGFGGEGELDKRAKWGADADWGTGLHAAKAGSTVKPYADLMAPFREKLWPNRLGRHEVGVAFDCATRTVSLAPDGLDEEGLLAWKLGLGDSFVVGATDWWGELPAGEPWIDDFKTGWQQPEIQTPQLMFYLLCRMRHAGGSWTTGRLSITHWSHRAYDAGEQPEPSRRWLQLSKVTLDDFEDEVVEAWRAATAERPRAVVSHLCEYCPSALVCPRARD